MSPSYFFFLFTVLASVGFFNPHEIFSPQMLKLMFYIGVFGSAVFAFKDGVSLKKVKYPMVAFGLLIGMMCLSTVMVSTVYGQKFTQSVTSVMPFVLAYSYFFILMKMDLPRKRIIHTYMALCACSIVVYFANVLTLPNNMFGPSIFANDDRGIIRIPVNFIEVFPLLLFYGVNQWLVTKKPKWWILISICTLMIVLSVVRQIILLSAVIGLFFLFRSSSWKSKVLIVLTVFGVVYFVLPQIPMYNMMLEFSEKQRDDNDKEDDVRIQAWRFYTYEFQGNSLTPIFGNGVPSLGISTWGKVFESTTQDNGCFDTDVGWAGFFWYFGAIATFSLLYILIKALTHKEAPDDEYLRYWILLVMLTSIASGIILYNFQIITLTTVLYMIFKKDDHPKRGIDGSTPKKVEQPIRHIAPQYPQLKR